MKENLKIERKTLDQLDWPRYSLYEIVNNVDFLDENVIPLISLCFLCHVMHTCQRYIYRNGDLTHRSNIKPLYALARSGKWSHESGNTLFCGEIRLRRKERKTLKELCKYNNRR